VTKYANALSRAFAAVKRFALPSANRKPVINYPRVIDLQACARVLAVPILRVACLWDHSAVIDDPDGERQGERRLQVDNICQLLFGELCVALGL